MIGIVRMFYCALFFFLFLLPTNVLADVDLQDMIQNTWSRTSVLLRDDIVIGLGKQGNVQALYNVEVATNNLLKYAEKTRNIDLLSDLASLYTMAYAFLSQDGDGYYKWVLLPGNGYARENQELVGKEVKLCSSQFLFVVASLIDAIANLESAQRTPVMDEFIRKYVPVILQSHYLRWVAKDLRVLEKKIRQGSQGYHNAVSDTEMFVMAGVVKMLAAHSRDASLAPLTDAEKGAMMHFIATGSRLLKSRLSETRLVDFNGKETKGLDFDAGVWSQHPDFAYAGYVAEEYPQAKDKKQAVSVSWDINHARRFVDIFDTLYDNRAVIGQTFPEDEIMQGLANQVVYGVFNGDFKKPLFTNFMNGGNGWYRVGYAGRKVFGYGPYKLSSSIPTGGYGFWDRFNPDIHRILMSFQAWSNEARNKNEREFLKYYGDGYWRDEGPSLQLLEFLPTIAQVR